jgi:hypothetical protein
MKHRNRNQTAREQVADLLLDDEPLEGAHSVHLTIRPHRLAYTASADEPDGLFERIRSLCEEWSGASSPIIPIGGDRVIRPDYQRILPGSAIDRVEGLRYRDLEREPIPAVDPPPRDTLGQVFRGQLAFCLLDYRKQSDYRTLDAPELDRADPWYGIYAACLGLLADAPDARRLKDNDLIPELTFEDFVCLDRTTVGGSLKDLTDRLSSPQTWSPRQLSMFHLAHGEALNNSLRRTPTVLPNPRFAMQDGQLNVVVVCTPDNVDDLCLLWNLRAAYGDRHVLPIGIPADQLTGDALFKLTTHPNVARAGFATRSANVTSTSVPLDEIRKVAGESIRCEVVSPAEVLTFGPPAGWPRQEIIAWRNSRATIVPISAHERHSLIGSRPFARLALTQIDIRVPDRPIPGGDDIRLRELNGEFFAGRLSLGVTLQDSGSRDIRWPSRSLLLRAVGTRRGVQLTPSSPGKVAEVVINGLSSPYDLTMLAHAPLLKLPESMASHTGASLAKRQLRERGQADLTAAESVASTVDDLPERSFNDFRTALQTTKAARTWLHWAETSGLLVKGFPLTCASCHAKQWTPVTAFSPPITCRGCAQEMTTPFDSEQVAFKWRISERMRRLYEADAMGHLMLLRYFALIFNSRSLIGMYPGIDVTPLGRTTRLGEADLLLMLANGDVIPAEVKRSFSGVTDAEVDRLEAIASSLRSPWSCLAVSQYASDDAGDYADRAQRDVDATPFRIALTWDHLLDLRPRWTMGNDPFGWAPLNEEDRTKREKDFVKWVETSPTRNVESWLDEELLRPLGDRPDA